MKVAYFLATSMASTTKLATMILPQLEHNNHGADLAGIFFFDYTLFCLRAGDPIGERLARVAKEKNILFMVCDQCAVRRNLAEGTLGTVRQRAGKPKDIVEGVKIGCFPQIYGAVAGRGAPDFIITL